MSDQQSLSPQFVSLLSACRVAPGATVSKPLVNIPGGRVVAFAMDAGQEMSEHRTPFPAAVHVIEGRLKFTIGGEERTLVAHDWLAMPGNEPHSLIAEEPTRFLLTLFKHG